LLLLLRGIEGICAIVVGFGKELNELDEKVFLVFEELGYFGVDFGFEQIVLVHR
jgi:hypothetical protein